jgi:hypothetical protein
MISTALYSLLAADGTVAALVATRIYPLVIPQRAANEPSGLPCLVYSRVGVARQQKFCGTDDLVRSTFQIDCYAQTYGGADDLASATRGALVDFRGSVSGVEIKAAFLDSEYSVVEPEPGGLFRVIQRFVLWHDETP